MDMAQNVVNGRMGFKWGSFLICVFVDLWFFVLGKSWLLGGGGGVIPKTDNEIPKSPPPPP